MMTILFRTIVASFVFASLIDVSFADGEPEKRPDLFQVKHWGYQLQGPDFEEIAASPLDLIVIDASRDGSREGAYLPEEIDQLKTKPDGSRRLVISYLSIGEAEDYRGYWQEEWNDNPPEWLGEENSNWPGNYLVEYWNESWQTIIEKQFDRVIDAGFDGVYFDRVDIYWDYRERPTSEEDIIAFVKRLVDRARDKNPSFLIMAQNAEALFMHDAYAALLDGEGKEDLFFGINGDEVPNSEEEIYWSRKYLLQGYEKGVPIFVIEYLQDETLRQQAREKIRQLGFLPIFAERSLSLLPQE
ncbi:MJ1477/TM1410 family putative glycoside hydrolase [uncultured Cohaesibacter sp.]|uniref:MJ1477/TM1410 family putative glycoside hydrolase n=1 Tax=uncultured Cohaesibacter sp. TaxID=1002546 RepID=UPI00292EF712|nr:MJ1477/TM1410 family putative glycoside hydrolase [uncultured Cohaesibacter sp.]